MKDRFCVWALVLTVVCPAWAQLASSHASTLPTKQASTVQRPMDRPVARVNGVVLTDRDLLREEYTIFPYARQHGGVPSAMEPDIRAGAMKMIIFEELIYQEAVRQKMTVPSAKLQRAEAELHKQYSPAEYQQLLNTEFKGSPALLRAKLERSLLIDDLLNAQVNDKSKVSLAEARVYYDKNPSKFHIPESFTFQSISFLPPANATAAQLKEAHKRAQDALAQAKATKSYDEFGLLAEKVSEDDFRVMMGEHNAADRTKLPPAVVTALLAIQPGQVSDIIEFDSNDYTILRLKTHIPAGTQPFGEVKDSLRQQLQRQKSEDLRRSLDARLRKNAKVEEL
jgi:PPIC-type PPIASE domain/SurA-like N-terminal domain